MRVEEISQGKYEKAVVGTPVNTNSEEVTEGKDIGEKEKQKTEDIQKREQKPEENNIVLREVFQRAVVSQVQGMLLHQDLFLPSVCQYAVPQIHPESLTHHQVFTSASQGGLL